MDEKSKVIENDGVYSCPFCRSKKIKIKGSVAATGGTIHYVKIGNVVTFSAEINTANGSKEIATMPFKPIIKTWCGVGFSGTPSNGNWAVLNTDGTLYISKAHSGNVLFITGTYICV